MTPLVRRFAALPPSGPEPASEIRIRPGTPADYHRLAALHYRAGRPATVAAILAADHGEHGVVGVLVVSRPTLNARWRQVAWPGRYRTRNRRADAARLNAELRTISRVIVDPRFRALGIAARLVRAYLAHPQTAHTEAVAAMGAVCPFFAAAGMRAWRLGPTAREVRLRRAMRAAGLRPVDLLNAQGARRVERALRVWADASRATRGMKSAAVGALGRAAAGALIGQTVAYTHGCGGEELARSRGGRARR